MSESQLTLKKARFQFEETTQDNFGEWIDVQYNPENLSVSQSASWQKQSASNGAAVSPIQFQSTNPKSISMDLIFDMTATSVEDGDVYSLFVRRFQNALVPQIKCTKPAPKSTAQTSGNESEGNKENSPAYRPPRVKFNWGNMEMTLVVKSLKAEYTMFSAAGKAIRAKMSLTLEEYLSDKEQYIPNGDMGGYNIKQVKLVQVQQGQTLSNIALKAGMTTAALADLNGIDNPFSVMAGTVLKVKL